MKISGHIECLKSAPGSPVRNPAGRSGAGLSSIELDVAHASVLSRNSRSASLRELRALTAYDHLVPTAAVMAGRRDAQGSVIRGSARVRARERAARERAMPGTTETRRRHARSSTPSRTRRLRAVLRRLRWPNVDVDGRRPGGTRPRRGLQGQRITLAARGEHSSPGTTAQNTSSPPRCAASTPRGTASPDRLWAHARGRGAHSLDLVGKPDLWLTP